MVNHIGFWLLIEAAALIALYIVFKHSVQFRSRTLDEVIPNLRRIDYEQLKELFSPIREEETLRFIRNPYRLRRTHRARLDQAREHLLCMLHNSRILQQWAIPEYQCSRKEPQAFSRQTRERIVALCQSCMMFRHCAAITLLEINFWMIISSIPGLPVRIPGAAGFRQFGHLGLLAAYEQVRNAAAELALVFGEEHAEAILQSM